MKEDGIFQTIKNKYPDYKDARFITRRNPKEFALLKSKTSFLKETTQIRQRLWHLYNDLWDEPLCINCKEQCMFSFKTLNYSDYCKKCFFIFRPDRIKAKKTMMERYGVEYAMESKQIREKYISNFNEKYGTNHPMEVESFRNKQINAQLEKYGKLWVQTDEFTNKMKDLSQTRDKNYYKKISLLKKENSLRKYNRSHKSLLKYSDDVVRKLENKEWLEQKLINEKIPVYILAEEELDGYDSTSLWGRIRNYGIIPATEYRKSHAENELFNSLKEKYNLIANSRNRLFPRSAWNRCQTCIKSYHFCS